LSNELVINSTQNGCRIALLKDKKLVEFHQDDEGSQFNVGDLYVGSVKKVVPGLNAAFVDIGYEKDAFLHYLDLGPQLQSLNKYVKLVTSGRITGGKLNGFRRVADIDKLGKMTQVLNKNQKVLVQVVKEPISTKGPRLSCELSLAGRYLVLVPFSDAVSVSKKISNSAERKRLLRLVGSIKPENFGVIIRTVAEGRDVAELDTDLSGIVQKWIEGMKNLKNAKPGDMILGEMSRANSILRDVLNETFDSISVDDKTLYTDVKSFIGQIAPEKQKIVREYNGRAKIFEAYGIEKQLKGLFGTSVSVEGGGYLIIEHTEALHVIDVNSGSKSNAESDQEKNALTINIESAKEIARQLRLRDMGGIIVIDFIDMRRAENKKKLFQTMKDEMRTDRSKSTILPLSKFGLLQITRQRVRPELNIATREVCPSCGGSGKIQASILVADQVENDIDHLLTKQNEKKLTVCLHPYLYAYFTTGFISRQWKWFFKYKRKINLIEDSSMGITEYSFVNGMGEEIKV